MHDLHLKSGLIRDMCTCKANSPQRGHLEGRHTAVLQGKPLSVHVLPPIPL